MSSGLNIHTIEIQDEIINYLRKDNERLRDLLRLVAMTWCLVKTGITLWK